MRLSTFSALRRDLEHLGWLPGVFITGESRLPSDEYTRESRLPGGEYTGEFWLLGTEYTGESITNTNKLLKIQKNLKSFLGMSNRKRRSCLMKKSRVKKSCDTVPLTRNLTI
jgi:hypothetical protein